MTQQQHLHTPQPSGDGTASPIAPLVRDSLSFQSELRRGQCRVPLARNSLSSFSGAAGTQPLNLVPAENPSASSHDLEKSLKEADKAGAKLDKVGSFTRLDTSDEITNERIVLFWTPAIGKDIKLIISCFYGVAAGLNFPRPMTPEMRLRWNGGWGNMIRLSGRYFMVGGPGHNDVEILDFLKTSAERKTPAKMGLGDRYYGDEVVLSFWTTGVDLVIAQVQPHCRS
jgi:hypothetical protein